MRMHNVNKDVRRREEYGHFFLVSEGLSDLSSWVSRVSGWNHQREKEAASVLGAWVSWMEMDESE